MAEMTTQSLEEGTAAPLLRVSLAQGLLLLLVVLAGVLRFSGLSALPLSLAEVQEALPVWQFGQAQVGGPAYAASPVYFTLSTLLAQFAGYGDATMRLVPAFFGVALVLLPWLWRERLGTAGALTTGSLLAVSPAAALLARTAGGDAAAAAAILLLLIGWLRYQRSGRRRWLYTAAGALGLGLASSPLFYSGLLTLALAWLVQAVVGPALPPPLSLDGQEEERRQLRNALLLALATFAALASLLFWHPAGLGAAAGQLGHWLADFTLGGGLLAWLSPLLALGRYEVVVISLGIGAIAWAMWQGEPLPVFLVYWFAFALLLALVQHDSLSNVLLLALPVYLLIGLWVDAIFSQPASAARWGLLLLLLILGAIIYFNGARYLRLSTFAAGQLSFLLLVVVAFVFALIAFNLLRTWDPAAAWQGGLLAVLLILAVYQWGTAWWLTHEAANDPRAGWVEVGSDDDLRLLQGVLADISQQVDGSPRGVAVVAAVESPLLRWYLRDFENLEMGSTVPPGATSPAIITASGSEPALGDDYFGMDFGLYHTGTTLADRSPGNLLRWWLFHEATPAPAGERIILWVRNVNF